MTGTEAGIERVLAAMADPTRRHVLSLLAESAGTGTSATSVAGQLPVSRQAVVKHLAILDAAGLVAGRRTGREVRFVVQPDTLTTAADWLADIAAQWRRQVQPEGAAAPPAPAVSAGKTAAADAAVEERVSTAARPGSGAIRLRALAAQPRVARALDQGRRALERALDWAEEAVEMASRRAPRFAARARARLHRARAAMRR